MKLNVHELKMFMDDDYRENVLKHQPKQTAQELLEELE